MCFGCGSVLNKSELAVCQTCKAEMPRTNFIDKSDNKVAELFWGLVHFSYASALFYFQKDARLQRLMHALKYHGQHEIGVILGNLAGKEILNSTWSELDYIIPIPLHPNKFKKRGYNQSEKIGEGISQRLMKPMLTDLLLRSVNTDTQTKKNKSERRENMQNVFELSEHEKYRGKHFLLVDDVLTTGATMESAANVLLQIPDAKVSIYALALAGQF
jgi:ComF family protein